MDVQDLLPVGITLVVVTIALAFGLQVLGEIQADFVDTTLANCGTNSTGGSTGVISYANCGIEYNATTDGLSGLSKLTGKLPTIGLILAAVVIIAVLVKGFSRAT